MPREFAHLCFAICISSDPITYEQLSLMLQSEEQAMPENFENPSNALAMYASSNKHSNNSQFSHIIMVDLTKEEEKQY